MIHILLIASLLLTQSLAHNSTQHQNETAVIFKDSKVYEYYGCYNETTQIQDSAQIRALDGGNSLIKKGDMTVPMCLEYCSNADGVKYTYAGLEWSRECWCSQRISSLSEKLDDSECSYPCEGNSSQICGGSLKLTVYTLSTSLGPSLHASIFMTLATSLLAGIWLC